MSEKKVKNKKILIITTTIIIIIIITTSIICNLYSKYTKEQEINQIKSYYNDSVVTNQKTNLYTLKNNKFIKSGKIAKDVFLTLDKHNSNYEEGYFKILNTENDYYIYYENVDKTEEEIIYDERYKNYIPFNKNIITKESFSLYDDNGILKYTLNYSKTFEVIVNNNNFYGIVFDSQLLYIKNEDILEIVDSSNTKLINTKGIAVLNYHFVYNDKVDICDQTICHTETQFKSHLEYIKNNNIFTPTLKELEMYIDGYIQLPKSVVITIDDGWHSLEAATLLNQYQLNGTVFLITSGYDPKTIESEYVEVHSHTHNMHKARECPTGQGGGIQCLSEEYIQEDLRKSREKLNNTTYFCYPFYEYNSYSISQLKKAGFTMAFAGKNANNQLKAAPGIDKYQIPRYVISNKTTDIHIKNFIG